MKRSAMGMDGRALIARSVEQSMRKYRSTWERLLQMQCSALIAPQSVVDDPMKVAVKAKVKE